TAEIKEHLRAAEREKRRQEEKGFRAKRNFVDIIGSSPATKQCISEAKIFAKSEANVMIYGETGVGKEIFAQSIHNRSFRKDGPFIAINCAAIPDNLLEAELFGYDEGAFTGGRKGGKKGLFELADGGTLFLDEIGDISPALQSRLLRVLQEREVMHIGGERMIPIDVRVIAATNRDLEHYTNEEFRRDLLYRLNVLELKIPPLRERSSDAAELFEFYFKIKRGISIYYVELTEGVREIMQLYSWPGNIRELQNCCERFVLYLEQAGKVSSLYMKKSMVKAIGEERLRNDILNMYGYDGKNATPELVEQLKKVFSYNREQIAAVLGISRTTMWRITAKKV
uniref:sigma-54 interaction domain-containing protein n=1 Tax=Clostridium sp. AM58-1XD TaxID=2292307 RepID=UPI000E51BEB0